MNAAIALCHFCEAHGPCAIFCSQTLRDTKLEDINFDQQHIPTKLCAACNSLGQSNAIYSRDNESGATFLSTQVAVLPDVGSLVKQAAVRSLSCEINSNKDGGFVFFGDATRGHVLSHMFQVSDVQSRGFYQLFSIIILMKDKYFLLNIKPFLSEQLKRISSEIQASAQKIYQTDESKGSSRQRRFSSGQYLACSPRSLTDLTGEANIYAILHSHFSWILLAGSRFLTEHVTFGNLPWLPTNNGMPREMIALPTRNLEDNSDEELDEFYSLRLVKEYVKDDFSALCYCVITGVKVIIRGTPTKTTTFMTCLKKLLPEPMHKTVHHDAPQFITNSECKIVSVAPEVAVPMPSSSVFRIDFVGSNTETSIKWHGEMPTKGPDLLVKILKTVEEPLFTDLVVNKQTKVLVEEWKNKVMCLQRAKSSSGLTKLKKVLGIQQQDQGLVHHWSHHL